MSFQALCDQLPDCPGRGVLPITDNPGGFAYVQRGLPEFVGPDLAASEQIDRPAILIISAAGAMGKSTLAREIAARKHAPVWDLAQAAPVGGNSFRGQLVESFDYTVAANAEKLLSGGDLFVIIDALDEARVKVNEAGYEAFIGSIARMAARWSGTAFVLLGRTQTAETTWLLLADAGVRVSLLAIQAFTRVQAEQYIELRIRHFDSAAAKRIQDHRGPFVQARDLIFRHLEKAVAGADGTAVESATREFLGYAPVLETIAVLLATETNYADFIANLDACINLHATKEVDRPLAVLQHVVDRLLEREQSEKLVHNIRPALEGVAAEHGWDSWDSLYSPHEQRLRLLGCVLGREFNPAPHLPPAVRAKYEEQLKAWLPEHPFLREGVQPANIVFESYLFAAALREYLTDMGRVVENRIGAADYKASRLLADFYMLLGEQSGSGAIPAKHIGLLYDSLVAGETDKLRVRLSVEIGDPDEADVEDADDEGEFELVYSAPDAIDGEETETRSFAVVETQGVIAFRRQLKDATLAINGAVWLGGHLDDFEIGPSVYLRCSKLEIRSIGFVVRSGKGKSGDTEAVVLEATTCESAVTRRPQVRGKLDVSWPNADAYPWTDYANNSGGIDSDDVGMHSVYRRFRRIVTSLRSHSRGGLARVKDKVEHRRILKGEPGRALLDRLLADGIMVLKGRFYHWCPERADQLLKVSWDDLRHRKASPELNAYLEDFLKKHRGLF